MTFLAPIFFVGLLAIGLPLWLHRLSSENPNRQAYSSLMLLEPGEPRRVLAKNLQYLLLLAMRIALLVLLALAFAGPAVFRSPQLANADDARLHLIVLDTSASMNYGDRWPDAEDRALDVVGDLALGDRAQVVSAGRAVELLTQSTADTGILRAAIAGAEPSVFRLEFGQLMGALDGVLRGAELPVVLHLITDAQASGLPTRFAELAPSEPVEVVIHNVAIGDSPNISIESLGGSALTGELAASVASFTDSAETRNVTLTLDGEPVDQQTVVVPARGRVQVEFPPLELRAGSNRVSVVIEPHDELPQDDLRYIALQRPTPRPALLVSDDLRGSDTLFVESALQTLAALVVETETVSSADLSGLDLSEYRFVVVVDAGNISGGEAAALVDYVESGGGLMLAMGPASSSLASVPVTDQALQSAASFGAEDFQSIGTIDITHPVLRGLESIRAARFFRHTEIVPGPEDRVLMSLESGAPLLLERELGAGRVVVYTSTLDRQWNDLVVQPVFVPLISGLADHLLGGAGFSSEAGLGSTLAVRAMGLEGGQIFDPAGQVALGLGGGADVLLDQIGFYEVVGGGLSRLVAVNFDGAESDLASLDTATVERWQRLGSETAEAGAAAANASLDETAVPRPIGLWVVGLLLIAVIVESWAGNWHLRVRRGIAA